MVKSRTVELQFKMIKVLIKHNKCNHKQIDKVMLNGGTEWN